MNGVLCAGNKDKTNYVIIQLLLICHSQIKCQIKVRGALCLFNGLQATCFDCCQTTSVQVLSATGKKNHPSKVAFPQEWGGNIGRHGGGLADKH